MEGEDPTRRNNFTLGLQAEISVCVVPKKRRFEKELKMTSDKNKNAIWALLLSLLAIITTFQQNYHNDQLSCMVTLNEMVGLYCSEPAVIFVWFVPSTRIFLAKAVYMVLGSF